VTVIGKLRCLLSEWVSQSVSKGRGGGSDDRQSLQRKDGILKHSTKCEDFGSCQKEWRPMYYYACRPSITSLSVKFCLLGCNCSSCYLLHAGFLLHLFFGPEDRGDMFIRNFCWLSTHYMPLHHRRHNSSKELLWYPRVLLIICVCCLFNDAFSTSDCAVPNDTVLNEWLGIRCERKWSWPNKDSRNLPGINEKTHEIP
jgi:hypothetical protein